MDCEQGEFIKRNLRAVVNSTSSTAIIIIYLFIFTFATYEQKLKEVVVL